MSMLFVWTRFLRMLSRCRKMANCLPETIFGRQLLGALHWPEVGVQ